MSTPYLRPGLPRPLASDLDRPFWDGLREARLRIQRCRACHRFQWGPEWICHRCLNFDLDFVEVQAQGVIHAYERVWHPVHPALADQGPYLIVLVELPHADGVRVIGNLVGDPRQAVTVGTEVVGVFEQHDDAEAPWALLQWRVAAP